MAACRDRGTEDLQILPSSANRNTPSSAGRNELIAFDSDGDRSYNKIRKELWEDLLWN